MSVWTYSKTVSCAMSWWKISMLMAFGIESSANSVQPVTMSANLTSGMFDLLDEGVGAGTNPLVSLDSLLGSGVDYPASGINNGERGIGFGPKMAVPGLGTVDVPKTPDKQAAQDGSSAWHRLAVDWGDLINKELPVLQLSSFVEPITYSTAHYVDWPPNSSPSWQEMPVTDEVSPLMLEDGYIRPRK